MIGFVKERLIDKYTKIRNSNSGFFNFRKPVKNCKFAYNQF